MRINFSLSLKLTLIVVTVSAAVIFTLTYINIQEQTGFIESTYSEKAVSFAKALDAAIEHNIELREKETLQGYISHFAQINQEILQIDVNLPEREELITVVSSNKDSIDIPSSSYNSLSFEKNAIVNIPDHSNNSHKMSVIIPINLSGQIAGTYEISLSMEKTYEAFDLRIRNLAMIAVISLFILIFCFLFLLRKTIVKPITEFRDAAKRIGEGKLNAEIKYKSRDELGELSTAFNQMTTDLEKSRIEIKKYSDMLEELLNQKDEFIGQLGHDLKNPLTPLVGLLPVIMEREKDPEIRKHLEIIIRNVEYMRNLIIKTIQLARLRSPNTKFDIVDLNCRELIESSIENLQLIINEKQVDIENLVENKIFVRADKLRITELLNNLIVNSIRFTKKDKRGIMTINAKDNGNYVTISLTDNGIGMTNEQLSKIFDEFYKADESRHEMDSSGLGLSICKRIVEKHGGRIWADSPGIGKGSTFIFTLESGREKIFKKIIHSNNGGRNGKNSGSC